MGDDAWRIEDLGGKPNQIKIGATAQVTRESPLKLDQARVGSRFDVSGTSDDGRLQADEIALRGTQPKGH